MAIRTFLRMQRASSSSKSWSSGFFHQQRGLSAGQDNPDSHDDFKPVQKPSSAPVQEVIEKDINENPVMVYMKGIPDAPQCGFSAMVVRTLQHYGVPFGSRNVLEDEELRQGIKAFSKWPTVPQVYIKGEFVGGCDIITNMHRSGELKEKLKAVKPDLK